MQPPPLSNKDAEHLRLLAIFHYIVSGLSILGLGFLALHYSFMRMIFGDPQLLNNPKKTAPFNPSEFLDFFHFLQWIYVAIGLVIVVGGILNFISGRFIHRRVNRIFSIVIAALNCLHFPFGTGLGIFTLIVLTKDSVMQLYTDSRQQP